MTDRTHIADAVKGNWVDHRAPAWSRPWLRLARIERPIGTWLLLLPCWWGLALAGAMPWERPGLYILFAVGSVVMRAAGCVFNDIVDRNIDGRVARTAKRPIPSGDVSVAGAVAFMAGLCLIGLAVLLQLNWAAVWTGIASLGLVAIYPFMKRVTYWPQIFLGLAFNWGALVGWVAVTGALEAPAVLLYVAGIFWTLGYDTIYAHQDKEDDVLVGVKSSALKLGNATPAAIVLFYAATLVLVAAAMIVSGAAAWTPLLLAPAAAHFAWQQRTLDIDDGDNCLARFRANRDAGLLIAAALLIA